MQPYRYVTHLPRKQQSRIYNVYYGLSKRLSHIVDGMKKKDQENEQSPITRKLYLVNFFNCHIRNQRVKNIYADYIKSKIK